MRLLFIILSDESRASWAQELAHLVAPSMPVIFTGSPAEAATYLEVNQAVPSHIVLDIGHRGQDVLPEIDQLAHQCEAGTRVIAVGDTNDIILYRGMVARGVIDYLPMPASASELVRLLSAPPVTVASPVAAAPITPVAPSSAAEKRVLTFMSAASGDGASMAALNTAYSISQMGKGQTVLVDMDYQFGMAAKHLDLQSQYGIRELFDHPDRGVDPVLIKRMVAVYGKLHVITAPAELRYLPNVSADAIRDLITTLKLNYDTVVLDLPHVWLPWVAAAAQQSTHLVLTAQLWLKSVSHASRLMRVFRELSIPNERISVVINRSGAKFKEAIETKDFEKVCGTTIRYTLANDIKTIVTAEAAARTVMEMEPSILSADITRLARGLCGMGEEANDAGSRTSLFARLKK